MSIECISEENKNISSMLIMIEVQLLISHFNNDLDDDVLVTIFDTNYLLKSCLESNHTAAR